MNTKTGFLLGASTAAHQVEGNNIHSDCWALEQMEDSTIRSHLLTRQITITVMKKISVSWQRQG